MLNCILTYNLLHGVPSGRLTCKVLGSFNRTLGKYSLGISCVLKLNHLILTCEYYLMFTDDGSATDSTYTYLIVGSLLPYLAAGEILFKFISICCIYRVCKCQSCSTWCIHLKSVVLLNNLNIEAGRR